MKYIIAIALLSGTLFAQQLNYVPELAAPVSPANGPSYSQMHCAGFVTRESIPRTNYVLASKESPHEDRFPAHSQLFLGGPSLLAGQRYSVLRQVDDPNREDSSPEQRKRLAKLGGLYQDIGWVTVHSIEKGAAIASFDFSCNPAIPGDIVVPYQEKPVIAYRSTDVALKAFVSSDNGVKGQILGSPDFVGLLGTSQIVYTDFGSAKGAKLGDYLLIVRGYAPSDLNRIDRASEQLPKGSEAGAVKPAKIKPAAEAGVPQRVLGEVLVLSVNRESSTALITRAFSEMELGDVVESEDPQAQLAVEDESCQPASRLHRLLVLSHLSHGCKAAQ
jgi:hypothetical protein